MSDKLVERITAAEEAVVALALEQLTVDQPRHSAADPGPTGAFKPKSADGDVADKARRHADKASAKADEMRQMMRDCEAGVTAAAVARFDPDKHPRKGGKFTSGGAAGQAIQKVGTSSKGGNATKAAEPAKGGNGNAAKAAPAEGEAKAVEPAKGGGGGGGYDASKGIGAIAVDAKAVADATEAAKSYRAEANAPKKGDDAQALAKGADAAEWAVKQVANGAGINVIGERDKMTQMADDDKVPAPQRLQAKAMADAYNDILKRTGIE